MNYAPILIITLNRYEHLKRCIDSLKKNRFAENTDLYIGLDYPPNERYEEGYRRVLEYLDNGIDGFKNVTIIKQEKNKGAFLNFVELQQVVYEKHDRFIYSEDDNEFSLNYLEYMNKALEKYESRDDILAVSGYTYPISKEMFGGNVFLCNSYFSALGYGMWKKKEDTMRQYLNRSFFEKIYMNKEYMKNLKKASINQYANMVKGILGYTPDLFLDNCIREVDLAFALYMQAFQMKMVFPVISKVRNWGYDGSGVNCGEIKYNAGENVTHRNFSFEMQELDESLSFEEIMEESSLKEEEINAMLDTFFFIGKRERIKVRVAYMVSRIIGLKRTRRLIGSKVIME